MGDTEAVLEYCFSCRYAQAYAPDYTKFYCRRYPPRPVHNPERLPSTLVDAYDWCGEFQRGPPANVDGTLPTATINKRA
jgi:hypothetical protein